MHDSGSRAAKSNFELFLVDPARMSKKAHSAQGESTRTRECRCGCVSLCVSVCVCVCVCLLARFAILLGTNTRTYLTPTRPSIHKPGPLCIVSSALVSSKFRRSPSPSIVDPSAHQPPFRFLSSSLSLSLAPSTPGHSPHLSLGSRCSLFIPTSLFRHAFFVSTTPNLSCFSRFMAHPSD